MNQWENACRTPHIGATARIRECRYKNTKILHKYKNYLILHGEASTEILPISNKYCTSDAVTEAQGILTRTVEFSHEPVNQRSTVRSPEDVATDRQGTPFINQQNTGKFTTPTMPFRRLSRHDNPSWTKPEHHCLVCTLQSKYDAGDLASIAAVAEIIDVKISKTRR